MANLGSEQIVGAIRGPVVERILEPLIRNMSGDEMVFDEGACGVRGQGFVRWAVTSVDLRLRSRHIIFDEFEIDAWPGLKLSIDFAELYRCIANHFPLPPLCWKVCLPFTPICHEECIKLGSASTPRIEIPLPLDLSALYIPDILTKDNEFVVYPRLSSLPPFLVDAGRLLELVCQAIASLLPWPLDKAARWLCDNLGAVLDFIEDFISKLHVELYKWLFDQTNGWFNLRLTFISLYKIDRNRFPGTGSGPNNPAIPVRVNNLQTQINSADELEISVFVHEPA